MRIARTGVICSLMLMTAAQMAYADPPKPTGVCLNAGDIDHYSYPDDNTILVHMKFGKVRIWRNDLPRTCSAISHLTRRRCSQKQVRTTRIHFSVVAMPGGVVASSNCALFFDAKPSVT